MTTDITTPYAIYGFFRSFRNSLPDENDFSDFVSTLIVTPMHAVVENVLPFFRRSVDPGLFTTFQMIMRQIEQSSDFESTFMRICDALDMLEKVEVALKHDKRLMDDYLKAMQFDNASASHQQVWNGLQRFLNEECDLVTKKRMEKVFADQKASDELGLSDGVLSTAYSLIGDDELYIEILETLQLNNRQNLPWDTVISRIQKITNEKKPQAWPMLHKFLEDVHNGRGIDKYSYTSNGSGYVNWDEYVDDQDYQDGSYYYDDDIEIVVDEFGNNDAIHRNNNIIDNYNNADTSIIEQKLSNINLEDKDVNKETSNQSQPHQQSNQTSNKQREIVGTV